MMQTVTLQFTVGLNQAALEMILSHRLKMEGIEETLARLTVEFWKREGLVNDWYVPRKVEELEQVDGR